MWAIPWAVVGGICGVVAGSAGPRKTAAVAVAAAGAGIAYNFSVSTFGGWQAITIPVSGLGAALVAVGLLHVLSVCIAREPDS
jgi:hypothetical protein